MNDTSSSFLYVQFGCGLCAPTSFRNFDAGPAFWLQSRLPFLRQSLVRRGFPDYPRNVEYGDVIGGLPLREKSVDAVYCSHVLEHLALDDLRKTLRNVYLYLKPGGIFRFVLPDLEGLARRYLESSDAGAASQFMRASYLGVDSQGARFEKLSRSLFGRSAHLWMWDHKNIELELKEAGFTEIRRAVIGDNPDPHFAKVEDEGRWKDCLGMQCRKG